MKLSIRLEKNLIKKGLFILKFNNNILLLYTLCDN